MKSREIIITEDSVARKGAELLLESAVKAVRAKGFFSLALSGGTTPKALYTLLADKNHRFRDQIPWEKIHFFWGDERHVPPDHPASNYRMVNESLLSKLLLEKRNIHPVPTTDNTPEEAAEVYDRELRTFFRLREGGIPSFDLILLGMGDDGHTASLFPGSSLLCEKVKFVAADPVPRLNTQRVSFTPPVINNAALVIFMVNGEKKAGILRDVIEGGGLKYPSQRVSPSNGRLVWIADRAAGKLIGSRLVKSYENENSLE